MFALFQCYFDPDQNDETDFLATADSREKLVAFSAERFGENAVFVDSPLSEDFYETVKRLWIVELVEDENGVLAMPPNPPSAMVFIP
jgi:hypothetical protein